MKYKAYNSDGIKTRAVDGFLKIGRGVSDFLQGNSREFSIKEMARQARAEEIMPSTPFYVGKRSMDDANKVAIRGQYIPNRASSKNLLIIVGGFGARDFDYVQYVGTPLAQDFHVYATEIRNQGWAPASVCARDLAQIDVGLRQRLGVENVAYIGHSMGMNIVAAAKNLYGLQMKGMYAMFAFPSLADTKIDDDLEEKRPFAAWSDIGPFGLPLKKQIINEPIRFAIPGEDEVLHTGSPIVERRFRKAFSRFPRSSSRVFPGKNHCFNYAPEISHGPINQDDSQPLVDDIRDHLGNLF